MFDALSSSIHGCIFFFFLVFKLQEVPNSWKYLIVSVRMNNPTDMELDADDHEVARRIDSLMDGRGQHLLDINIILLR